MPRCLDLWRGRLVSALRQALGLKKAAIRNHQHGRHPG